MILANYLYIVLALSLAGTIFALYMSLHRIITKTCPFNEECPDFFGFPACYFGFLMFLTMFVSSVLTILNKLNITLLPLITLTISTMGVVFSGSYIAEDLRLWLKEGRKYGLILPSCAYGLIFYLAIAIISGYIFIENSSNFRKSIPILEAPKQILEFDGKNQTYVIDGKNFSLVDGFSEQAIENSSSTITTRYFGNEVKGDLTYDGKDDIAYLLVQNLGGSGTFYYAVVAVNKDTRYELTNAFFIGDRIAPQNNQIISQELRINYAERKEGEPMTTQPSIGVTKLLRVTQDNRLVGLMTND